MGDAKAGPVCLSFNPQLRVEFRGATVTSDAGLLLPRELDERLGLSALIERHLSDPRTGYNRRFPLPDLFRQSIYSRLAGYEDTNDAERLAEDPTFRMLASRERRASSVALTSTLYWFETEVLTAEDNHQGLARLNTALVQRAATVTGRVTLDIDSSESPVHGAQEHAAYNGHFASVCYHPLFVFNQNGDCLAAKLRPGNVPSARGWEEVLLPVIDRHQDREESVVIRADAAFALPAVYEALEQRGGGVRHSTPGQSSAGAGHRGSPHPAAGPAPSRSAGALPELPLSGRLVGPPPARDREGRASSRRVIPAGRLHRDHPDRDNRAVVHFYNGRGTAEQWINEGKAATHWTRLSCHRFRANEVRLLLGVIAYNLGNLLRRLTLPLAIQSWSLTSLQQRSSRPADASSGMPDTSSCGWPRANGWPRAT